jgi:hypothetical protein
MILITLFGAELATPGGDNETEYGFYLVIDRILPNKWHFLTASLG